MRTKLILIFLTIFSSSTTVLIIGYRDQVEIKNGFQRSIKPFELKLEVLIELPSNYYYFAGNDQEWLYLKDIKHKKLVSIDYSLEKITPQNIDGIILDSNFRTTKINVAINQEGVLINNRIGDVRLINPLSKNILQHNNLALRFDQAYPLAGRRLVVRQTLVQNTGLSRNISTIHLDSHQIMHTFPLEKQIDGFFCTDGILQTDTKQFFYMYFYRGQILCLDSTLNLKHTIKTIDTIEKARMEVVEIPEKGNLITQKNPPRTVNRNFFIDNAYLYVLSALKADNEKNMNFRDHQIIDVYTLKTGKYELSFYIPKYQGEKVREVRRIENKLFVIAENRLLKYQITGWDN